MIPSAPSAPDAPEPALELDDPLPPPPYPGVLGGGFCTAVVGSMPPAEKGVPPP